MMDKILDWGIAIWATIIFVTMIASFFDYTDYPSFESVALFLFILLSRQIQELRDKLESNENT